MSNETTHPIHDLRFAYVLALGLYSVCGYTAYSNLPDEVQMKAVVTPQSALYETAATDSSNDNLKIEMAKENSMDINEKLAEFYSDFASKQVDLGSEFETAMMRNLTRLYEI